MVNNYDYNYGFNYLYINKEYMCNMRQEIWRQEKIAHTRTKRAQLTHLRFLWQGGIKPIIIL